MKKKNFAFDNLAKGAEEQISDAEAKEKESIAYIKKNIQIIEEFKFLVPPLAPGEFHKLEISIKEEGCRDPLVVWQRTPEEWVLVDGHNRYTICEQNSIQFNIVVVEFADYDAAVNWIVNNQLGKRNATEETKSYLRGLQYNREKKRETNWQNLRQYTKDEAENEEEEEIENEQGQDKTSQIPTGNTAERLGALHKVSEKTIKRDERFALVLDKMCGNNHQLKSKILQRDINPPKGKLSKLVDEPEEKLREFGEELDKGVSFAEALERVFQHNVPQVTDFQAYSREKVFKGVKNNIIQSLENVIKTGDKKHIQDLRAYLDELEKQLQEEA